MATIGTSKVNEEESMEVAGGKCWKKIFLQSLCFSGETFQPLSMAGHIGKAK